MVMSNEGGVKCLDSQLIHNLITAQLTRKHLISDQISAEKAWDKPLREL